MSAQTQEAAMQAGQAAAQLPPDQAILQIPLDQAAAVPAFSWSGYFMTIAVLCLLLAGLWIALRWLKKRGTLGRFGGNADLEMESRLSLGPKKNLLIVRLRDRRLVLGITEHHISKLAELPLCYYDEEDEPGAAAKPPERAANRVSAKR